MITFQKLIAASFHPVNPEKERLYSAVFQGSEGGRVPGYESGTGIHLYRHDALKSMDDYYDTPLYMLHNPERNSCLLATTSVPFRDEQFLTETAEAYTAEEAFQKVAAFFSGSQKKVVPTRVISCE